MLDGLDIEIAKQFTFDAAHRIPGLPPSHKCHRLHGHTYRVELRLRGPMDRLGFVREYDEIAAAWRPLHDLLDHRFLNEVEGMEHTSTEFIAVWIAERLLVALPELVAVRVAESTTTWAQVETRRAKSL